MKIRRAWVAAIATCTVLGATACAAAGGGAGGSGDGLTPEAQEAVGAAYEGSFGAPPSNAPAPEPGQNIWLITSSASFIDFEQPGHMVDAAEQMGWDLTVFDGQFNPDTMVSGLRQAIADQADGVILFTIDCVTVKAGLEDVKEARIPIVGFESVDCDQTVDEKEGIVDTGEPRLFDAVVTYQDPSDPDRVLTFIEFLTDVFAPYQALGIIEATDGAAKIIKVKETDFLVTLAVDQGFDATVAEYCPDCEVVETIDIVGTDLGPALQDKTAQAIARHPEANAVFGIYDSAALSVAPAVQASGRSDDIFVMGGEGGAAVVDLVAQDRGIDAGVGYSIRWDAWDALDAMNRLLAGETPDGVGFPSGNGAQVFDRERNLPDEGTAFDGPIDFESAYREAWGLE